MPTATPRCVCLSSGHCFFCIDNGRRCSRPECRCTCGDGVRCGRVLPVRQGGSPAMPLPELEGGTSDETIAPEPCGLPVDGCVCILDKKHAQPRCLPRHYGPCPEPHDDCTRAVIEHDAPAPVTDLEAVLRASLRPLASWASKPAARPAMARDLDRDERARCRRIGRTVQS